MSLRQLMNYQGHECHGYFGILFLQRKKVVQYTSYSVKVEQVAHS